MLWCDGMKCYDIKSSFDVLMCNDKFLKETESTSGIASPNGPMMMIMMMMMIVMIMVIMMIVMMMTSEIASPNGPRNDELRKASEEN